MSVDYISHCKTCGLTIDCGNDSTGIMHELFKILHLSQYPGHEVKRVNEDTWFDDWKHAGIKPPNRLYSKSSGFVIQVPDWVQDIIDNGWIKEAFECGDSDSIYYFVNAHKHILIDELRAEYLKRLEDASKNISTINNN